ncbi:hypothetical protein M407DRAFT_220993 [Tulasnella calospora MUT 4182]|uniref:Conidiation protein 6 n=1 Tax=Tulasnella calospora MUT 4182 TaxID=1051891 RepID=A0A0C3MBR1_9AGAM|nr:hypothetical protein M407DRAFT_220993 [Tulasnella calospora MUT 4182]
MSSASQVHDHRVIGGHKAAIQNPNVSEEAKERSRQILEGAGGIFEEVGETTERTKDHGSSTRYEGASESLSGNQIRGYKATLSNPRTSEDAKEKAREILEGEGEAFESTTAYTGGNTEDEHTNRVLGGYKAAVHNPNVSTAAKRHAHQVLRENDADVA